MQEVHKIKFIIQKLYTEKNLKSIWLKPKKKKKYGIIIDIQSDIELFNFF